MVSVVNDCYLAHGHVVVLFLRGKLPGRGGGGGGGGGLELLPSPGLAEVGQTAKDHLART